MIQTHRKSDLSQSERVRRAITIRKEPKQFQQWLWPSIRFYREQWYVIESVQHDDETFVVAGNKLGKDFIAGFLALWYFMTHREVRVVTTSVKDDHLRVLWGEIGRFIQTSRYPLDYAHGGPLILNHRDIRKVAYGKSKGKNKSKSTKANMCSISYLRGMVSEKGEGMAGHHAEYAMGIIDEASGADDIVYTQMDTWAKRKLIFGNPMPSTGFFYKGVKAGNLLAKEL